MFLLCLKFISWSFNNKHWNSTEQNLNYHINGTRINDVTYIAKCIAKPVSLVTVCLLFQENPLVDCIEC